MNVIIIESKAYSVSKKELNVILKKQIEMNNEYEYKKWCELERQMSDYLNEKTEKGEYKDLGYVRFDFRL